MGEGVVEDEGTLCIEEDDEDFGCVPLGSPFTDATLDCGLSVDVSSVSSESSGRGIRSRRNALASSSVTTLSPVVLAPLPILRCLSLQVPVSLPCIMSSLLPTTATGKSASKPSSIGARVLNSSHHLVRECNESGFVRS
jgi:hypothetical protein